MGLTANQQLFLNTLAPMAIKSWNETHIVLPSITIAQGIIESRWGQSDLAVQANNLFGIKVSGGWGGEQVLMPTKEFKDGKYITIIAAFRKYPSYQGSVDDHTVFLSKSRYSNIHNNTNAYQVATYLQLDGYATSPTYATTLINTINTYNLTQYDAMGTNAAPITVPPTTNTIQPNGKRLVYSVQAGAYKNKTIAEEKVAEVKAATGYKAIINYDVFDGYHHVQVGAFYDKNNAIIRKNELEVKGIHCIIKEKYI